VVEVLDTQAVREADWDKNHVTQRSKLRIKRKEQVTGSKSLLNLNTDILKDQGREKPEKGSYGNTEH